MWVEAQSSALIEDARKTVKNEHLSFSHRSSDGTEWTYKCLVHLNCQFKMKICQVNRQFKLLQTGVHGSSFANNGRGINKKVREKVDELLE